MLLTDVVEINTNKLTNKTKLHYKNKGYDINKNIIEVKVNDLTEYCRKEVKIQCDYCLEKGIETIINKTYQSYLNQNKKSLIHKDCCKKCRPLKMKESNMLIYGVESTTELSITKEKMKETNKTKYGTEYYSSTDEFKEKYKNTCQEKYGCDNTFQVEEYKEKSKRTNLNKYGVENFTKTNEYIEKTKKNQFIKIW